MKITTILIVVAANDTDVDTIGKFLGVGTCTWFQSSLNATDDVIGAIHQISTDRPLDGIEKLEQFIVSAYIPKNKGVKSLAEARWSIFCKKNREHRKITTDSLGISAACFKSTYSVNSLV